MIMIWKRKDNRNLIMNLTNIIFTIHRVDNLGKKTNIKVIMTTIRRMI